ncbi:hypothetical protein MUK42_06311 [Musa troglodytarum]|uniref:BHLH domain-containing protein n=1 Tax=Musa troglodytarum TaxID=320322 RepID=A0A9E7HF53_9LILI|nr:hypothetical protein MUK42_06311 [Musa troglodytarum]
MDDRSSYDPSCRGDQEKISYSLGHVPTSLSSYSCEAELLPSSSSHPISAAAPGGGGGRGKSLDQDLDSLDWESEEGVEAFEEDPVRPAPSRSSGSKRSRAAEVHNMSEKRRRSRINEKMRALQNLIPNSNKTDKASMLDEAIEYLKQLQLQVQILSMRNGLNLQSIYMSGALQPLQTSQMSISFALDNDTATGDERNSISTNVNAKQLGGQASTHIGVDRLEQCMLGREGRSEAMLSNDESFIRHLHRLEEVFRVVMQRKDLEVSNALMTNMEVFKATRFRLRLIHLLGEF